MAVLRPPALDKNAPIVDVRYGRITPYFQRFWQNISFVVADAAGVDISGKVDKSSITVFPTMTVSNPPTQAQVQAIADALHTLTLNMKA